VASDEWVFGPVTDRRNGFVTWTHGGQFEQHDLRRHEEGERLCDKDVDRCSRVAGHDGPHVALRGVLPGWIIG
jgi:hypothetical protein